MKLPSPPFPPSAAFPQWAERVPGIKKKGQRLPFSVNPSLKGKSRVFGGEGGIERHTKQRHDP